MFFVTMKAIKLLPCDEKLSPFQKKSLFFSHGNFYFYFTEEKKVRSILVSCFYMVHYIFLPVKMQ